MAWLLRGDTSEVLSSHPLLNCLTVVLAASQNCITGHDPELSGTQTLQ